ncbi:YopJ family acetyltransferase [Morganella sp. GD04133]|nr:YopJ family acetyltransferase [Morganella sp. GD04133]MDH0354263.1 hypothetical protein [Morganella sp. GD04133]
MGEDGIHFGIIDCKKTNEKISLILFEPSNFKGSGSSILAFRVKNVLMNT